MEEMYQQIHMLRKVVTLACIVSVIAMAVNVYVDVEDRHLLYPLHISINVLLLVIVSILVYARMFLQKRFPVFGQLTEFPNRRDISTDVFDIVIQLLRQYRHDVMNDLQLIRGFYQLNRTEQMMNSFQQVIDRAQKQAILSSYPDTNIAFALLEADILYPLLDLEIVSIASSESSEHSNVYTMEGVAHFRHALQVLGTYAQQHDLSLLIDVEFLQNQVIRMLVYGKHEDRNWKESLQSKCLHENKSWQIHLNEESLLLEIA
ncbi:Spo0B domain-containing protein [Fodinisporobacter ferrooxydans]|uniref:Spo0B domain-containing protein n=1 Tax=Fodinisporobacter ferrooxydans TaxID=2901836 RepID=A0ABY4CHZ5_9BACL|nr:Spo0B domain-containing protein [Alicyclobacillaceae bacterium MYW30-H2]